MTSPGGYTVGSHEIDEHPVGGEAVPARPTRSPKAMDEPVVNHRCSQM